MSVWLYVSIECPDLASAQAARQRFVDAGLNPKSSRVHVAVGDSPHEEVTPVSVGRSEG